jgi:hypothetical protein
VICPANASALREPRLDRSFPLGPACVPHQELGGCNGERYPRSATVDKRKLRVTEGDRLLRNLYPSWLASTRPWGARRPVEGAKLSSCRLTPDETGIVSTLAFTSLRDGRRRLACESMTWRYSRRRAALMRGAPSLSETARATANIIRNINTCEPQARATLEE